MEKVMHTPGPWFFRLNKRDTAFIIENEEMRGDKNAYICDISWWTGNSSLCPTKETSEANARLIAASPDMLALLRDLANELEGELNARYPEKFRDAVPHEQVCFDRDMLSVRKARAIIARIEGEE